jgi:hypothetical protein
MNTRQQKAEKIDLLNRTTLSLHVTTLFNQENAIQETEMVLCSLLFWAATNLTDLDWAWMEEVTGAAAHALDRSPERLYRNLDTPGMEYAETLEEAAMICLGQVVDLIVPDNSPASRYQ